MITDDMVERAAAALFALQQAWDEPFSNHSEFTWTGLNKERTLEARKFRSLAHAALEAALPEPVEDVLLTDGAVTVIAYILPPQNGHDQRVAVALKHPYRRRKDTHGNGPTIDAAIRDAVAKGGKQ